MTLGMIAFGVSEGYAANEIVFDATKSSYKAGDIVELKGQVKDSPNQLVAIEVKDPEGNTIVIRTVQTDEQGAFVLKFKLPSTTKSGTLDIVANTEVNGTAVTETKQIEQSGGCLIATAAFGSELAPQVQMLREVRDNTVMHTQSGAVFMTAFNSVYYFFAPTVADWERENPVFKETVKATITPLIASLSILQYLPINSEAEMLGYGIGVILLNIGMYFIAPAFVIMKIRKISF